MKLILKKHAVVCCNLKSNIQKCTLMWYNDSSVKWRCTMDYVVKINEFEGPLDLLLHLVRTSEVDIYDIEVSVIAKQYIDYIKTMEKLNLEIASEYLVMAADLVRIKSAMLLPKPKVEEDSEYEEDPKQKLIEKLVEYKKFKEASSEFVNFKEERELTYHKIYNDDFEVSTPIILDTNVDTFDLLKALSKMKRRKELSKPLTTVIEKYEVSVEERMVSVYNHLKSVKEESFTNLFDDYNKGYIITTFLAILELVKEDKLIIDEIAEDDFKVKVVGDEDA